MNERQMKAIEFIKHGEMMTMKEFIALFPAVNRRTLTRDLDHLIKLGLLIRKGKGKRDLYYVLP